MKACVVLRHCPDDPLAAMELREVASPEPSAGWVKVRIAAASINMHDLWTLRGVGQDPADLPLILGCDAAGVVDAPGLIDETGLLGEPGRELHGREVMVLPVIADADAAANACLGGDETLDPHRALLSERHDGTFAEEVCVPLRCLVPKPAHLSMAEASCVPVAWGTAFRMLRRAGVRAGMTVLVQGATGGVNSAAIQLAGAMGARVWVTSRSAGKREVAERLGAAATFETGARLPERVDVVVDNVGEATFAHSLRCLKPGGVVVTCGATTGPHADAELNRIFFQQLSVIGSTACTRAELLACGQLMENADLRPLIDSEIRLSQLPQALVRLEKGEVCGKVVVSSFTK